MQPNELHCPWCGGETECLAGESAHPLNWYCKDEAGCGWQAWNTVANREHKDKTNDREAMTERQAFEKWYVEHAFDYDCAQLGSRDSALQWAAWQAAIASLSRAAEPVARIELDETSHAYVKWLCGIHECIGADLYTSPPEPARDAKDGRTALDDALQFGTGFTVDGKRIDPSRVCIYHGHPKDDAAMAQESGE